MIAPWPPPWPPPPELKTVFGKDPMGSRSSNDLTRDDLLTARAAGLRRRDLTVILSHGLGVETAAIWKRWVDDPASRPFTDWGQVIVVTSQVGHEHKTTVELMERHQLPEMRRLNVRFVELARRGHLEADGIVVLQDTRQPEKLHPEGHYKLGDELLHAGTVPQYSGEHRCALKFKAFVIESWLAFALRGTEAVHVWGYNAGELSRIAKSDAAVAGHNEDRERPAGKDKAPVVVFGFNNHELGRVARSAAYDGPHRTGYYPLLEWDWDRARCLAYLQSAYGVEWVKSACGFCPFNEEAYKVTPVGIKRFRDDPAATADGLFVEYVSLCMNAAGQLYRDRTMLSVIARDPGLATVRAAFEAKLDAAEWALYEVRRIYTIDPAKEDVRRAKAATRGRLKSFKPKPMVARAVRVLETGDRATMTSLVDQRFFWKGYAGTCVHGIARAHFAHRGWAYPTCEGFVVAAPRVVADKVRGPMAVFDRRFAAIRAGRDPKAVQVKPRPTVETAVEDEDYFKV
jgi:hypothetical protein